MMVLEFLDEELNINPPIRPRNIRDETLRRVRSNGIDVSLAEVYTGELIQGIPHAQIVNLDREHIAIQNKDVERCERDIQACIICIMVSVIIGGIIYLVSV